MLTHRTSDPRSPTAERASYRASPHRDASAETPSREEDGTGDDDRRAERDDDLYANVPCTD
jgi:hypothetical protein